MSERHYLAKKAARRCVRCTQPAMAGRVRCGGCCGSVGVSRVMYERISRAAAELGITRARLVDLALANLPEAIA